MYSSEKNLLVSQVFQQTKQKKKNAKPKPVYRDLLDNEKNLLNFVFSDYHDHEHNNDYRPPKISKTLSYMDKRQLKQNYLQGNFRFLVNPDYEENITYVDPDQEVKWRTVEKVKYITNNLVVCSICLNDHYEMIQPKITRCGHIFCWPCVMRYLSYEKSKCPLCDDFLMKEDLRTVQIIHYTLPAVGEKIHLKLKKRRRTENTVYNSESFVEEEDFIRIKKISWEDILKQREEETRWLIDYLSVLEIENEKDLKPFVEQCLTQQSSNTEKIQKLLAQTKKKSWSAEEEHKHHEAHLAHVAHIEEEFMHFYQEVNGLNVFLHPIDNKYLKIQHNDDSSLFPLDIQAPIVEVKGFQQTDHTQRRYKFLNHLPLNSDVSFVEIDMKDLLSPENLQHLKEESVHQMDSYKHVNNPVNTQPAAKKEKPVVTKPPAIDTAPKRISVQTDSYYNIQFPVSPSSLKLNDTHDYPELSAVNSNQQAENENNAWKTLPKKNNKLKKSVSVQPSTQYENFQDNLQTLAQYEEEQRKAQKEKENIDEDDDGWHCVKADKKYLKKGKNE